MVASRCLGCIRVCVVLRSCGMGDCTKKCWEVLCAGLVAQSSTGKCLVAALQYKVVL